MPIPHHRVGGRTSAASTTASSALCGGGPVTAAGGGFERHAVCVAEHLRAARGDAFQVQTLVTITHAAHVAAAYIS